MCLIPDPPGNLIHKGKNLTFCFSFWTSASQVLLCQALLWPYKAVPKAGQTSLPSCHTSFISLDYAFVQDSLPYPKILAV